MNTIKKQIIAINTQVSRKNIIAIYTIALADVAIATALVGTILFFV